MAKKHKPRAKSILKHDRSKNVMKQETKQFSFKRVGSQLVSAPSVFSSSSGSGSSFTHSSNSDDSYESSELSSKIESITGVEVEPLEKKMVEYNENKSKKLLLKPAPIMTNNQIMTFLSKKQEKMYTQ
jgi:hypothetical protein